MWFNGTALNDALTAEVQRLKLATAELGGEHPSKCMVSQLNHQMFQMQQQQQSSTQMNIHQLQHQQQQQQQQSQQQNGSTASKSESIQ